MIILDSTSKSIEVLLTSAVTSSELSLYTTYTDINTSTALWSNVASNDDDSNGVTAVTLVAAPSASISRKVNLISIHNDDSVSAEVTVRLNNSSTYRTLQKKTLQPDETLQYTDGDGWTITNKKKAIESTLNTTTSTLAGGATYTGTGELNDYPDVMVSVFADVPGTLYFEYSENGTDWYQEAEDESVPGIPIKASETKFRIKNKGNRWFRAKYTNGASAQSTFRLYTRYGDFGNSGATVNKQGRMDVIQHAHADNTAVHFNVEAITASQDFILVDISDTTNYKHQNTDWIHLEWLRISTDGSGPADYFIEIGFLENVDGTDGDFYPITSISGSNTAGRSVDVIFPFYPNGAKCSSDHVVTSTLSQNDTAFNTATNLASTLDPATADTPSGDNDLVMRVTRNAGEVDISVDFAYHTH